MTQVEGKLTVSNRARVTRFRIGLGLAVTLAACVWLYKSTDWTAVGLHLRQVRRWDLMLLSGVLYYAQIGLRALRWWFLFPSSGTVVADNEVAASASLLNETSTVPQSTVPTHEKPRLTTLFDGVMTGNLGNYLLPLRAGEVLRPYLLARETHYSFLTCLLTTIVERFFDLFIVLISFGLILLQDRSFPDWFYHGAYAISTLAIGIMLLIFTCTTFPPQLIRFAEWFFGFLPVAISRHLRKFLADFIVGTEVLRDRHTLFAVLFLSFGVWLITFGQYQLLLACCNLNPSFWFATTITVMIALAIAAPSSPGFIGIYQIACVAAFSVFGQDKEVAVTYAIVSHSLQYLLVCTYGIVLVARYGFLRPNVPT